MGVSKTVGSLRRRVFQMEEAVKLIVQIGQFAGLVIVVWVVVMLFNALLDRHPRNKRSGDE